MLVFVLHPTMLKEPPDLKDMKETAERIRQRRWNRNDNDDETDFVCWYIETFFLKKSSQYSTFFRTACQPVKGYFMPKS